MLSMILRETRNTTIQALIKICNAISNKNPNIDKEFEELNSKEHKRNIKALMKLKDKFMNRMKVSFLYDSKNNMLELKDSPIDKGKDTFLTLFKNRVII